MNDTTRPLDTHDLELLARARDDVQRLRGEMSKVIVGQDATIRWTMASILARGHTLIVGVPGLAKTLLVRTLAQVLGWTFRRIQFTPDMMPADIIGMELLQDDGAGGRRMQFVPGPIFAHLVLADEINRTPPKTQAALLEAMQEHTVTSWGKVHVLEEPFIVFATQNPIEQEGTYPLPEAQLDRFMFSLWMDYPTVAEERAIALSLADVDLSRVQTVVQLADLLAWQKLAQRVPIATHVVDYAVALARATRPTPGESSNYVRQYVTWGAGPRASQYLLWGARALAVLDGVPAVTTSHVREVAPLVLRHRVLPNYHATGEGISSLDIVHRIITEQAEPVEV